MTNEIVPLSNFRRPVALNRVMSDRIGLYRGRLTWRGNHYSILRDLAPPEHIAAAMDERIAQLQAGLASSIRTEVAHMVTGLFLCFPSSRGMSTEDAKQTTAMYVAGLEQFPSWALRQVFTDARGNVGRAPQAAGFMPTAAELAHAARKLCSPYENELGGLLRIRGAAIESPEEAQADREEARAAMQHKMEGLAQELRANNPGEHSGPKPWSEVSKEEAEAFLANIASQHKGET